MMRVHSALLFCLALTVGAGCSQFGPTEPTPVLSDTVVDAEMAFLDSASSVRLTWTAPLDPEDGGPVARYEIRYQYDDAFEWDSATPVLDPPAPARPGVNQFWELRYPEQGRVLSMVVAAVDAADSIRPGNVAVMTVPGLQVSGIVRDALHGTPESGIEVVLRSRVRVQTAVSDGSGLFRIDDVPPGVVEIEFNHAGGGAVYYGLKTTRILTDNANVDGFMIPQRESDVVPGVSMLSLLKAIVGSNGSPVLAKWAHRPVAVYAPPHINAAGVDYAATTDRALQRWNEATGIDLFTRIDTIPQRGVVIHYHPKSEMGLQVGFTEYSNDENGLPLRDDVSVVNDFNLGETAYRVILHELGHTIRFGHLSQRGFIMFGGQPLPGDISTDEIWLVRIHENLPTGTDLRAYFEPGAR